MKRILVGVDGSEHAGRALALAIELARGMQSEVLAVAVLPPMFMPSEFFADLEDFESEREKHAQAALDEAVSRCGAAQVPVRTRVAKGPPDQVISALAQTEDADLVVVGTHGRGAVGRVILGSISDRLVHLCPKPVLVAR